MRLRREQVDVCNVGRRCGLFALVQDGGEVNAQCLSLTVSQRRRCSSLVSRNIFGEEEQSVLEIRFAQPLRSIPYTVPALLFAVLLHVAMWFFFGGGSAQKFNKMRLLSRH